MGAIATVKVRHPDGYQVINQADYDPALHVLVEDVPAAAPASAGALPPDADLSRRVEALMQGYTLTQLKRRARDLAIAGRSSMNEAELATAIAVAEAEAETTGAELPENW